ncbi:hypothetical protein LDL77_15470 [Flagellimonas marinaquae]|nr:hypothetical protein LDL77_15470 [Allomuricauda aquimarina]
MEKLKHSEDAILKLGKKIIKELQLEHTGNTLVRWMIHYISELMENADKAPSGKKKEQLRKECCQAILDKPGKVTHLRRMKLTRVNELPRFDLSLG